MRQFYLRVLFQDGSWYEGEDVLESRFPGWAEMPEGKKISKLAFRLADAHRDLNLEGCDQYNFFVEEAVSLGPSPHRRDLKVYLMGDKDGWVEILIISPYTHQIVRQRTPRGKEYNGTATFGWR